MLQFLEIANGNTVMSLGDNLEANMNQHFPQIIDKYRTKFQPSKKISKYNSMSMKKDVYVNRNKNQLTNCGDDLDKEQISVNRDVIIP